MRTKTKRSIFALLLVFVMALSLLAGCNKQDQPSTNPTPGATTAPQQSQGGLKFPELPNNTLKLTANIPNFGTSPTGTLVQEEWQKRMEEYHLLRLDWK